MESTVGETPVVGECFPGIHEWLHSTVKWVTEAVGGPLHTWWGDMAMALRGGTQFACAGAGAVAP